MSESITNQTGELADISKEHPSTVDFKNVRLEDGEHINLSVYQLQEVEWGNKRTGRSKTEKAELFHDIKLNGVIQ